jgi:membrane peptidoglycan carboxypeptidase
VTGPVRNRRAYDDVLGHVAARRRRRRAVARRRGRRSAAATAVLAIALGIVAVVASGGVGATLYVSDVLNGYDLATLKPHYPGVTTRIYDRDGHLLALIPSVQNRTPVRSSEMSPLLKLATVDVEDKRFYQHGGVDYQGVLRAAYEDVTAGGVVQGASTIEQQLVRNVYLSDEQSLTRKLREAYLATQMANEWSKNKILTTYLNTIPYGPVTYGCEAAAAAFFNNHCSQLNLVQSAMIAGLPQSPTEYNPKLHPAAAKARRNQVLAAMYAAGHITLDKFNKATAKPLGLKKPTKSTRIRQPYFVEYVRQLLKEKYGKFALKRGGLQVKTTLDPVLQEDARQAITETMNFADAPAAAMVAIDPRTGEILAMQSSTDYTQSKFNLAVDAKRQAGSTFKTYGLLAAMVDFGINPYTTQYSTAPLEDYPLIPNATDPSQFWTVANAEQTSSAVLPLDSALEASVNAVFARLSIDIGAYNVANMAYKLGIPKSDHLPEVPSVILGSGAVSPLDMTHAYSTIAANGVRRPLLAVTRVEKYGGEVVRTKPGKGKSVIPDGATAEITKFLDANVHSCCTGLNAAVSPYRPQAGKTGTTDDHTDAWFCGYTPNLTACVWVGYPRGEISMDLGGPIPGPAFGGGYPATIWNRFATAVFADEPAKFPPTPWPVPKHFLTFKPWHSPNFTLPVIKPSSGKSTKGGSSGGGSSGGGSSGGGSSGGTTTGGPPTTTR